MFRGRALGDLDRPAEAATAYRSALAVSPHEQSAGAALTALYLVWNNPAEARRWAAYVANAPVDATDPWWSYALGDYRFWPKWRDELRRMAR